MMVVESAHRLIVVCSLVAAVLFTKPAALYAQEIPDRLALGVALGGQMALADFERKTGVDHPYTIEFFNFPKVVREVGHRSDLTDFMDEAVAANAIPIITIETRGGMNTYDSSDIEALATILSPYSTTPTIIRYNHEMNGGWYPWGHQPTLYVQKFREFATVIRARAPQTQMAWTPNQGDGYPWGGGDSLGDDPYALFYPGDMYVDWVGLSAYHRGYNPDAPEGDRMHHNVVPSSTSLSEQITDRWTPDVNFYKEYAEGKNKPMVLAETSALYRSSQGGASEASIKGEWMRQLRSLKDFPYIKAICWFSVNKYSPDADDFIDWRADSTPSVMSHYQLLAETLAPPSAPPVPTPTPTPIPKPGDGSSDDGRGNHQPPADSGVSNPSAPAPGDENSHQPGGSYPPVSRNDSLLFQTGSVVPAAPGAEIALGATYSAEDSRTVTATLYRIGDEDLEDLSWEALETITQKLPAGSGEIVFFFTPPKKVIAPAEYLIEATLSTPTTSTTATTTQIRLDLGTVRAPRTKVNRRKKVRVMLPRRRRRQKLRVFVRDLQSGVTTIKRARRSRMRLHVPPGSYEVWFERQTRRRSRVSKRQRVVID